MFNSRGWLWPIKPHTDKDQDTWRTLFSSINLHCSKDLGSGGRGLLQVPSLSKVSSWLWPGKGHSLPWCLSAVEFASLECMHGCTFAHKSYVSKLLTLPPNLISFHYSEIVWLPLVCSSYSIVRSGLLFVGDLLFLIYCKLPWVGCVSVCKKLWKRKCINSINQSIKHNRIEYGLYQTDAR